MTHPTAAHILRDDVRDLSPDLIDAAGQYVPPSAVYFAGTTREERAVFGHKHAMYSLPTVELVEWLRAFIGTRSAMEIGAGSGVISRALNIAAVDNHMQRWPEVAMLYAASGQPCISYGAHVIEGDANTAVASCKPDVIVGAWITHRYNPGEHHRGGNMHGPDEAELLKHCQHYIHIGHTNTHAQKPLMQTGHMTRTPPWLYSRAMSQGHDFIAVFRGARG